MFMFYWLTTANVQSQYPYQKINWKDMEHQRHTSSTEESGLKYQKGGFVIHTTSTIQVVRLSGIVVSNVTCPFLVNTHHLQKAKS